jgi:hypothetical protein
MRYFKPILMSGLLTLAMTGAHAETVTPITPVNGNQSTTLTATVSEQATLTVPSTAAFAVTDINSNTLTTTALNVHADNIVLFDGNSLRILLQAASTNFTGPAGSTHNLAASKVTWPASSWTNGTGASGTLSSSAAGEVVTSSANASSVSNSALPLTLHSDAAIDRAGDYTLVANWTIESVAP